MTRSSSWRRVSLRLRGLPCVSCGRPSDTADHVVPLLYGGEDNDANAVPMCRSCNSRKGARITVRSRPLTPPAFFGGDLGDNPGQRGAARSAPIEPD